MRAPNPLKTIPVLVLDDDTFMLGIMRDMLGDLGISRVMTHSRPQEGLLTLDMQMATQLVICDINMPEMDGVEVIRHLGQHNYAGAVVVLSGEDEATLSTIAELGRTYRLRLLGALAKPIDPLMLSRFLRASLETERHWGEAAVVPWSDCEDPQADAAPAIFDAHKLAHMLGDKPDLHRRLIATFRVHAQQRVADLLACVPSGEIERASYIAYNLKSVARNVGAMRLGALCQDFETAGKGGDLAACQSLSAELAEAIRMTLATMPEA